MDDGTFILMVKPVSSRCNMRCDYCYYLHAENQARDGRMSDEVLEHLIRDYIAATRGDVVSFTWHGGEPTLAGLDFYERAVALQKKYLPAGKTCWNNLQTNGYALDDTWCDFLKREHFDVGVSVDGTLDLHDKYRHTVSGGGTYAQVTDTINRLKKHGITPDLLCTVTADTATEGRAVYRALCDLDCGWMQFIPIVRRKADGTLTEDSVTADAYGTFLKDVFAAWFYHDTGRQHVQLFDETAHVLAGGEASLCWMRESCGDVLVAEADGGIYACDHFVRSDYRRGNLLEEDVSSLADTDAQRRFGQSKKEALCVRCQSCPYLQLCHGGCLKDRFLPSSGDEPMRYVLCDGLYDFFSYAVPRLQDAMQLSAAGKQADEIRRILSEKERALFRTIRDNAPCPCGSGKKAKRCCLKRVP